MLLYFIFVENSTFVAILIPYNYNQCCCQPYHQPSSIEWILSNYKAISQYVKLCEVWSHVIERVKFENV